MEQTGLSGVDAAEIPDQVNQFFFELGKREAQTAVERYFESLKDRRKQHIPSDRYVNNLSEASSKDIEADFRGWFAGFTSGITLLNSKAVLPPLESVLEVITKSFETEIAA